MKIPFFKNLISLVEYMLLALLVLNPYKSYQQEIINPNPNNALIVHTNKPVYYYSQDKLYYSPTGEINLDRPIWQGKISERFYNGEVLVSPDSRYVVIHHELGIDVIDSAGSKICQIKNVAANMSKRVAGSFWNECFQWSTDSKNLYFVKDSLREPGGRNCRSSLFKLNLNDKSFVKIYDFTEQSWDFYLGPRQTFYYTAYDKPKENWQFKKVDLDTKLITSISRDANYRLQTTDTIYANLPFEQRVNDKNIDIGNRSYENCNIYAMNRDGTDKLVFEVKCGKNKFNREKYYHLLEGNADFYLSNQYFFGLMYTKNYRTVVVDLKTLEYRFYNDPIKPYVASTIETNNLIYIGTELRVK